MNKSEIQNYIDFLMSLAIKKCDDIEQAKDLVQETILALLVYLNKNGKIKDIKGWLITVLNRKYYDSLRKKYNMALITIGEDFDIIDEKDTEQEIIKAQEKEEIRRETAYLAEIYRSIIYRYYFKGQSILEISEDLNIPKGTVKSRLDFGRKQIKKGLETMENYTENSYSPQRLNISYNGSSGMNDEPCSLVSFDDLISQNLLILSYEKPLSLTELAKAIGIPTAYIEPMVNKLVDGQLMKRMGDGKVYTDFIIYDIDDFIKYVKEQEKFAKDNSKLYCPQIKEAVEELKQKDFYSERLERFMIINIAQGSVIGALEPHLKPEVFPDRPNGGRWSAFGIRNWNKYNIQNEKKDKEKYLMDGISTSVVSEYLGSSNLALHKFETSLYGISKYDGIEGYNGLGELERDLIKLFYLIKKEISPESIGFSPKMIQNIPILQKKGMIEIKDEKPVLLVPYLTHKEYREYCEIKNKAVSEIVKKLTESAGEYIKNKKKKFPSHLKSISDLKRILPYVMPEPMCFVYEVINQGIHKRDLGYLCPETIIVAD